MNKFIGYDELKRSQEYLSYLASPEWKQKVEQRMKIDGGVCQCCGCRGTMTNPLTVHHFHYGNFKNEDVYKDLIVLCKDCHESQHSLLRRITDEDGGRMWDKNGNIPLVHTYTISGIERILFEEERQEHDGK